VVFPGGAENFGRSTGERDGRDLKNQRDRRVRENLDGSESAFQFDMLMAFGICVNLRINSMGPLRTGGLGEGVEPIADGAAEEAAQGGFKPIVGDIGDYGEDEGGADAIEEFLAGGGGGGIEGGGADAAEGEGEGACLEDGVLPDVDGVGDAAEIVEEGRTEEGPKTRSGRVSDGDEGGEDGGEQYVEGIEPEEDEGDEGEGGLGRGRNEGGVALMEKLANDEAGGETGDAEDKAGVFDMEGPWAVAADGGIEEEGEQEDGEAESA